MAALGAMAMGSVALAEAIVVDTAADGTAAEGRCSLREAIQNANDDAATHGDCPPGQGAPAVDHILFDAGLSGATILLAGAPLPAITGELVIHGNVVPRLIVSGAGASEVLQIAAGARVRVGGLEIADGADGAGHGGGIDNDGDLSLEECDLHGNSAFAGGGAIRNGGTLVVRNTAIHGNFGLFGGGGLFNFGTATLVNSTVAANRTTLFNGAGIWNWNGAVLTLTSSTVSGNRGADGGMGDINEGGGVFNDGSLFVNSSTIAGNLAEDGGGGIYTSIFGTTRIANSILAGNTVRLLGTDTFDCRGSGAFVSLGHNLFGAGTGCGPLADGDRTVLPDAVFVDVLGPLAGNGGRSPSHALLAGSPAIDGGDPAGCEDAAGEFLHADQRYRRRHRDGDGDGAAACDIGSYEWP